jgi:hypothetical protein
MWVEGIPPNMRKVRWKWMVIIYCIRLYLGDSVDLKFFFWMLEELNMTNVIYGFLWLEKFSVTATAHFSKFKYLNLFSHFSKKNWWEKCQIFWGYSNFCDVFHFWKLYKFFKSWRFLIFHEFVFFWIEIVQFENLNVSGFQFDWNRFDYYYFFLL